MSADLYTAIKLKGDIGLFESQELHDHLMNELKIIPS